MSGLAVEHANVVALARRFAVSCIDVMSRYRRGGLRSAVRPHTIARKDAVILRLAGCLTTLLALPGVAFGQYTAEEAHIELVRGAAQIVAVDADQFGAQHALFEGSVRFENVDISIPGNNKLPVEFRRAFAIDDFRDVDFKGVGDWDIDIPHLWGNFTTGFGWNSGVDGSQPRCSNFSAPRHHPSIVSSDYWQGNTIHVPGQITETILRNNRNIAPSDGASYPLITASRWVFRCLETTKNGYPGQAFVAVSPDGVKYTFDWVVTKDTANRKIGNITIHRDKVYFLVTKVEDHFGNVVNYTYLGDKLSRIQSNDGRFIQLAYSGDNVATATSSIGQWTYTYVGNILQSVRLPDQSTWQYTRVGYMRVLPQPVDRDTWFGDCPDHGPGTGGIGEFEYTVTSPSGAAAHFMFEAQKHWRMNVPDTCTNVYSGTMIVSSYVDIPYYKSTLTLISKTISGIGLTPLQWTYEYPKSAPPAVNDDVCPTAGSPCKATKYTKVYRPDGFVERYEFGQFYELNEGQFIGKTVGTGFATGDVVTGALSSSSTAYLTDAEILTYAPSARIGIDPYVFSNQLLTEEHHPLKLSTISQSGYTFNSQVNTFDASLRPTKVTKFSSLGYSRTEGLAYYDNLSKWVLGQVASVTCLTALPVPAPGPGYCNGNDVMSQTIYDTTTALPTETKAFGKTQQRFTYELVAGTPQTGTLKSVSNYRDTTDFDTTIHLSDWKRGIPGKIQYPATTNLPVVYQRADVGDDGRINWTTDENGYKTCYDYDPMGRLSKTTYPDEQDPTTCSTARWAATTITFDDGPEGGYPPAFGLPAGHWRQRVMTGTGVTLTFFDALWRPVVKQSYDQNNTTGTLSQTVTRYDSSGRPSFVSYPQPNQVAAVMDTWANPAVSPNAKGVRTEYDALSRVTAIRQDGDNGVVHSTTTVYTPTRLKTEVTDPNGKTTYTWFVAYDEPHYNLPVQTYHADGLAATVIEHSALGEPISVTRRNMAEPFTISATRSYAMNLAHEVCRVVEPETGATLYGYDAAGNLSWSAAGLPATTPCEADGTSSAVAARRVDRLYDNRNRLTGLSFPDGRGDQSWEYTRDGLPAIVDTINVIGANNISNTYVYNARRMLEAESQLLPAWYTFRLDYGYDANGNLATLQYPMGEP